MGSGRYAGQKTIELSDVERFAEPTHYEWVDVQRCALLLFLKLKWPQ
jgi:hypothetical protein